MFFFKKKKKNQDLIQNEVENKLEETAPEKEEAASFIAEETADDENDDETISGEDAEAIEDFTPASAPASQKVNSSDFPEHIEGTIYYTQSDIDNPLESARRSGFEIFNMMLAALREPDNTINGAKLLFFCGGLAGYGALSAVWQEEVKIKKHSADKVFTVLSTKEGKNYYHSDLINSYIFESNLSVYSLTCGMIDHLKPGFVPPEMQPIVDKVNASIHDKEYRICGAVSPDEILVQYNNVWNNIYSVFEKHSTTPEFWAPALSMTIQRALELSKDYIDPVDVTNLIMESAFYCSRFDISERYK